MIYVIGIGVEGRGSLTERSLGIIRRSSIVIGGTRHLGEFPEVKEKMPVGKDLAAVRDAIRRRIKGKGGKEGKGDITVLATGDPNLFGIADFLVRSFGKENVEIIPNVSVVQAAFARIKENWNGVRVLSFHGRSGDFRGLTEEIFRNEKVALFTDSRNSPTKVLGELKKRGVEAKAYVFEALGTEEERVREGTPSTLSRRKFHPLNMMVLVREDRRKPAPPFGIPDRLFSASGMITKEEIRAVALSKMRLKSDSVVWDIGSGCGSVAIEASFRAGEGLVYAVEKEKKRASLIERNKRVFGAENLTVIEGVAPGCLRKVKEDPDAVFVGGGGIRIERILDTVSRRIRKGGRVVVNAVTMETAGRAFDFFKRKGWHGESVLLNAARTKDIGGLSMLRAHNPVFVITGVKP